MKPRVIIFFIIAYFMISVAGVCVVLSDSSENHGTNINVEENRLLITIEENWSGLTEGREDSLQAIKSETVSFEYTVISSEGEVLLKTREDLSENINQASENFDAVRDVEAAGFNLGKLIIHNSQADREQKRTRRLVILFSISSLAVLFLFIGYSIYFHQRYLKPFHRMKGFAERVAMGDLDAPLEMDRGHSFGAFTESFDLMRDELKNARLREEKAVRSRKELVAELSHDIKTPVASIKAMADVLELSAEKEADQKTAKAINVKADQIDRLVSNLFHATLEELEQLEVTVEELPSTDLIHMVREADYLGRVERLDIKDAVIFGDRLRLNQVISNLIYNSYKYADTELAVHSRFEKDYLIVEIADKGGGVPDEELELIMQKFKRGSNSGNKDGAGLGLYISKYLMEKMSGYLSVRNEEKGFTACLHIRLA
ncbi:MAG: HAMP domain-containing histidine kinase [Lachnospiraceae bacterium]|nr:HAMP domain-containing histidine kinase [Lachnospiraceae bacterium]